MFFGLSTPVLFFLLAYLPVLTHSLAFDVFSVFKRNPLAPTYAEAQVGSKFLVKLDIGQKGETHLFLDGLKIELLRGKPDASQRPGLPGYDGPHPGVSSGAFAVETTKNPFFVDMYGKQKVRFEKGCFEIVWKKDNIAGSLIMGFDVPFGAKRNNARLPQGAMYLSFPVWTQEGLAQRQAQRYEAEQRAKEHAKERDDELMMMQKESNLFKKALHYRNAAAALEKIDLTGVRLMTNIPSSEEVIPIADGLLMNIKGSVWNKDKSFLGGKHVLLGTAVLSPLVDEEEAEKEAYSGLKP